MSFVRVQTRWQGAELHSWPGRKIMGLGCILGLGLGEGGVESNVLIKEIWGFKNVTSRVWVDALIW